MRGWIWERYRVAALRLKAGGGKSSGSSWHQSWGEDGEAEAKPEPNGESPGEAVLPAERAGTAVQIFVPLCVQVGAIVTDLKDVGRGAWGLQNGQIMCTFWALPPGNWENWSIWAIWHSELPVSFSAEKRTETLYKVSQDWTGRERRKDVLAGADEGCVVS